VKIALAHDFLNQYGGAERTLEALHEAFPEAPIFTSVFVPDRLPACFSDWDVRTSFMQNLPFLTTAYKKYLPLYPRAFERFDLSGFDVVLSSSSAFAKGIRVPPGAVHICYCYTPMRFVWDRDRYLEKEPVPFYLKPFLNPLLERLRRWDLCTARSVHRFIAISEHIRRRIRAAYGAEADVLYPPVDVGDFPVSNQKGTYDLVVSRLNPYKRIEIAIAACERLGRPLKIVGQGPHASALRRLAGPRTEFLGAVPFDRLKELYAGTRAFLFPGEEDFGIAPVEAMAAGRPVIAYGSGGALETVVEGETGLFFREPTPESLIAALRRFEEMTFEPRVIRRRAEGFRRALFVEGIRDRVRKAWRDSHVNLELRATHTPLAW